jgi:glycosyltransferase involved in cell wall biosynthesis
MPAITALLHTANDAMRLGRALETLRPCDEILIVDHDSHDGTLHVAREYGAQVLAAGRSPEDYLQSARNDWILCLEPREALTEGLEASLYEWKSQLPSQVTAMAFSVFLREETAEGWLSLPSPQTRLVSRGWDRWNRHFPADHPSAITLEGELLRFRQP